MATALVLDITPPARTREKNHKWTVMVLGGHRWTVIDEEAHEYSEEMIYLGIRKDNKSDSLPTCR